MSDVSIPELVELCKTLQGGREVAKDRVLARLGRAHQIVDACIALMVADVQSERTLPDAMLSDLETARDAVFEAHAASTLEPLVNGMASLHNKLDSLCWLVGESQADQDETLPGSFSNADDLFKAMGV